MLEQRNWLPMEGASAPVIDTLRAAAPDELPESYIRLLTHSDGGEGPLPVNPFNVCLDPAREVIARLTGGSRDPPQVDGFLVFGGNGGSECIAFDMRHGTPWPIVTIDMVVGSASAEVVTSDFDEFIDLIGVEPPNA